MRSQPQQIFENPYPNSILRTNNITEVRETCKKLLQDQELFTDTDFVAGDQSISNSFDKVPNLPKIEWRRPNQISLRSELVGFYDMPTQPGKTISTLQGSDYIIGSRFSQGSHLDDRWLLNALGMISSEER